MAQQRIAVAKDRLAAEQRGGDRDGPAVGVDGLTSTERERKAKRKLTAAKADDANAAEYVRLSLLIWKLSGLAGALDPVNLGAEIPAEVVDEGIWWRLDELADVIIQIGVMANRWTRELRARHGTLKIGDKIAKLEAMAAASTYPAEAEAMRRRAAMLREHTLTARSAAPE